MQFPEMYSILFENDNIEDFDDWTEWLDYNDMDIDLNDFKSLVEKFHLKVEHIIKNKIAKISDGNNAMYLEFFPESQTFDVWAKDEDDLTDTIQSLQDYQILELLGIDEDDVYISGWECSIKDAREHPGVTYHYTTEEKWEQIQKHGGLIGSYGSGLTNQSAYGIFTTIDAEELAIGTYGDVCLELNLSEFQKDNKLKELDVNPEPEVLEVELRNLLLNKFNIESQDEASSDMSTFTMIVNHAIPLKYIEVYGN
jgi:hypothetical protein